MFQLPIAFFDFPNFTTEQSWFDEKLKIFEENSAVLKTVLGCLIFLKRDRSNNVIETIVNLNQLLENDYTKDIMAKFVPTQLQKEGAFACISCFECFQRDADTYEIIKEILLINCESLNTSKSFAYDIEKVNNKILIKNKQDFGSNLEGRLANFLSRQN